MASLIENFVDFTTYNNLPHIKDVAKTPIDHANDLSDLHELLEKYKVPKSFSIRLIHKHFDAGGGEVMVFSKINIPGHGIAQIMKPTQVSSGQTIRGIHYFVDGEGFLQAYEYANYEVPDMTPHADFLEEFCKVVSERNLQYKFGLKLKVEDETDNVNWTEFEFHQKRGTIMLLEGMPMPD